MNKTIFTGIIVSLLTAQGAWARDLGPLGNSAPKNLVSAEEITRFLANPSAVTNPASSTPSNLRDRSDFRGWGRGGYGWGGYGGWGSYYPSYYGYYGYPYYGYGYGSYWLNDSNDNLTDNSDTVVAPSAETRGQAPFVCFASNSEGSYFAAAGIASNALKTQESANTESLASDASHSQNVHQNLGCALISNDAE